MGGSILIKVENTHIDNIVRAVYSARNAMNSWNISDSDWKNDVLGDNDLALAKKLVKAGPDHSKFMRMINVTCDITAPLYWWKEFDTYKVGTVRNSCSTMHKIHEKEFTLDDFSIDDFEFDDDYCGISLSDCFENIISDCEMYRKKYIETGDKRYWRGLIQLLPSSYNQRATVQLNYAVLRNMYHSRKNHKLDEWVEFCKWIETLPYAKELICIEC